MVLVKGCAFWRKRRAQVQVFVPDLAIELQEVVQGVTMGALPRNLETALQPRLPAHIAAGQESTLAVDDDKLGMHDTEGQEEDALDAEVYLGVVQELRRRQPQLGGPCGRWVYIAVGRGCVEELLKE